MERRNFIKQIMTVSVVALTLPSMVLAKADKEVKEITLKSINSISVDNAIQEITGGKEVKESKKIKLDTPDIAENGAVVPVKVTVDSPMTKTEYVKAIHILNTKNSNSRCIAVLLTPSNDKAYLATRVKLSETQNIIALVELSDGTFIKATRNIKITKGGC